MNDKAVTIVTQLATRLSIVNVDNKVTFKLKESGNTALIDAKKLDAICDQEISEKEMVAEVEANLDIVG